MKKIKFCKASIGLKEILAVIKVMRSGWLTTGKITEQFEKEFAQYVGAKYAVAVSSCTAALHLCLKCLDVDENDNVYCPSLTFSATAHEIINTGANVIFGDVGQNLCLLVPKKTEGLKAVIPVHLTGNRANTDYKIPVIEDSAHRIERGQCLNLPEKDFACFSFYPTKNMTCGEGGMIATNSKENYEWLKKARHHGITKAGFERYGKAKGWDYEVEFIGNKANLPDILSAIGLVQLRKLDKFEKRRKQIIKLYNKELFNLNIGIRGGTHLYPILVENRDKFIEFMEKNNIQCSVHFKPLHKTKAYEFHNEFSLPYTEFVGERIVSLPLYPGLSDRKVRYICSKIYEYHRA